MKTESPALIKRQEIATHFSTAARLVLFGFGASSNSSSSISSPSSSDTSCGGASLLRGLDVLHKTYVPLLPSFLYLLRGFSLAPSSRERRPSCFVRLSFWVVADLMKVARSRSPQRQHPSSWSPPIDHRTRLRSGLYLYPAINSDVSPHVKKYSMTRLHFTVRCLPVLISSGVFLIMLFFNFSNLHVH